MRILSGDAFDGVQEQEDDVGALDGLHGPQHAVLFHAGRDLAAPADAGRVDQDDRHTFPDQAGVDGVAGGAGQGADDGPFLAQQAVDQAALADVGPADDGDLERILFITGLIIRRGRVP